MGNPSRDPFGKLRAGREGALACPLIRIQNQTTACSRARLGQTVATRFGRLLLLFDGDDAATLVVTALGADAVRELLFMTLPALDQVGRGKKVVRAPFPLAGMGMSAFWIWHSISWGADRKQAPEKSRRKTHGIPPSGTVAADSQPGREK